MDSLATRRIAVVGMIVVVLAFVADAIYLQYLPMLLPAVVVVATAGLATWMMGRRRS